MEDQTSGEGYQDQTEQEYQGMSVNKTNWDDDEIDLFELVMVLWRQRLLVLSVTFFCVLAALIYCFTATPLYKISAQVQSGITAFARGNTPVRGIKPQTIQSYFTQPGVWQKNLSGKAKKSYPRISAKTQRGSFLVKLYFLWPDPEGGSALLRDLIEKATSENSGILRGEFDFSKKGVELAISDAIQKKKSIEEERKKLSLDIMNAQKRLLLLKNRKKIIEKAALKALEGDKILAQKLDSIEKNIGVLSNVFKKVIQNNKENKILVLLYSTIGKQDLISFSNLKQQIIAYRSEIRDHSMMLVNGIEGEISQLEQEIAGKKGLFDTELLEQEMAAKKEAGLLQYQLSVLKPLEVVVPPFSSRAPVKPRKALICALGGMLGLFLGILGAFLREFWAKNRERFQGKIEAKDISS